MAAAMRAAVRCLAFATCCVTIASCTDFGPDEHEGYGTVHFALQPPSNVRAIIIAVTGPGIPSPLSYNFLAVNDTIRGTLDIPAGRDRRLVAQARDSSGQAVFQADTTLVIVHGQNVPIHLVLRALTGSVPVVITFVPPAAQIILTGRQTRGLVYDSGAIWVVHSEIGGNGDVVQVTKIDAVNGQVLRTSGDLPFNGRGVTIGNGQLWIADALADRIQKVDPATFGVTGGFATPGTEPNGLAHDGASLWLTDPFFQNTYRLTESGTVTSSFAIPNQFRSGLEWDGTALWMVTGGSQVTRHSVTGSMDSVRVFAGLPSNTTINDLAIGGGQVFFSTGLERIYVFNW